MKSVGLLVIAMLSLCGTTYAERTVWYVHPDSALNTIQAGLDSCADNDSVLVGPGLYLENIVWPNTQGIHLISESGPAVTIIDGDNGGGYWGAVIACTSYVDTRTIISGFTVQNGSGAQGCGFAFYRNSVQIIGNKIIHNYNGGDHGGGGIFVWRGSAIIRDNYIADNHAPKGGGICCWDQGSTNISTIISGNTITNNEAYGGCHGGSGSAIYCYNHEAVLKHNIISWNYGWTGSCIKGVHIIDSCIISNNSSGVVFGGNSEIHHCDIFGNNGHAISGGNSTNWVNAEYNWWGDATGPYHPGSNPGGLGDTVSDYVDFEPWLSWPVGVEEQPIVGPVETRETLTATIFRGPLQLPEDKKCKVFDIMGRLVEPDRIQPGIYFIEVDGVVTQKVVKVR